MRATELARQIREMRPIELLTISLDMMIEEALREARREALAAAGQAIAAQSEIGKQQQAGAQMKAGLEQAQQIISQLREAVRPEIAAR